MVENRPLLSGVTVLGLVFTLLPSNFMVTVELAENPAPVTVTDVPTGPELGSRAIEGITLNVFETMADNCVAETV